ncbi:MAG: hypothetical protein LC742_09610, partial [Acidobacteria bacterium]|nr:hypothetical protein [Acidobacteriota bacterium]
MAKSEEKQTALVPVNGAARNGHQKSAVTVAAQRNGTGAPNGNGQQSQHTTAHLAPAKRELDAAASARAATWRGWLRTLQIIRVLGTLGLFLFLENYEARAKFNRRMAARLRETARGRGRVALFQEWSRDV